MTPRNVFFFINTLIFQDFSQVLGIQENVDIPFQNKRTLVVDDQSDDSESSLAVHCHARTVVVLNY